MLAAVRSQPRQPLSIREVPVPEILPGYTLLRVLACGICRTDLHIIDGELPPRLPDLIPGHQIVGTVVETDAPFLDVGSRVGVSWIGGTDGSCWYCRHDLENLCDRSEERRVGKECRSAWMGLAYREQ